MKPKKTFIGYIDWIDYFDEDTTIEQKGQIFDAILRYQNGEESVKPEDPAARMVFNKIKKTMQADAEAYAEKCAKNSENIRKRWNTTEYERIRTGSDTDTDTDTKTDTDTGTDTKTEYDWTHLIDEIDEDDPDYWSDLEETG